MAERFRGYRLRTYESAIANEAILKRRPVYINSVDTSSYPMAAEFKVRSIMAAPLILSGEVLGAVAFIHTSDSHFFTPDHVA